MQVKNIEIMRNLNAKVYNWFFQNMKHSWYPNFGNDLHVSSQYVFLHNAYSIDTKKGTVEIWKNYDYNE